MMYFQKAMANILSGHFYEVNQNQKNISERYRATFPSENWGTRAWSYRLLRDFIQFSIFVDQERSGLKGVFHRITFFLMMKYGQNSYHRDFESKINLFQQLQANNVGDVLVPECGPLGFDIFLAKLSGAKKIVAFDANESFVNICKNIFADDPSVEITQSRTEDFKYSQYKESLLIVPDWPHFNYDSLPNKRIQYSLFNNAQTKLNYYGLVKQLVEAEKSYVL